MPSHDPRVDAYIERAAEFARPVLERLRSAVHEACPQVEETIKWSMPSFQYGGRILCNMAAFKRHASLGFRQHAQVTDGKARDGMGSLGKLVSLEDLSPRRELIALVRKATALIDTPAASSASSASSASASAKAAARPVLRTPADLRDALAGNPAAKATFDGFSPCARRDYIEWIIGAKRTDTRERRLTQAIAWMAEGKMRHWKYQVR
nr:YdeI/OmpD-associated family protein [uncultured Pseudoxanthomonas sp.]